MKKIIDDKPAISGAYFNLVFYRSERVCDDVGVMDWVLLTLVEFIVGEELLEQFVVTAFYNNDEVKKVGHFLHLNDMIPAGIITNVLRNIICQLLYYKYYKHYLFLASEPSTQNIVEEENEVDLRRDRFAMRHELLYQVIAFRRVYILVWVIFNLFIDVIIYMTIDLQAALLAALSIEGLRRLFRL